MVSTLSFEKMTINEKLQIMEALWQDLCSNQEQIPVPQWHKEILDSRARLVEEGQAKFMDWDSAKKRMADRIA